MKMQSETRVFVLLAVLSLGFAGAAATTHLKQRQADAAVQQSRVLHVAPETAMGKHLDARGDPSSPYTLVEFADYECPPCRATHKQLPKLLAKHRGKVKLIFRNLPLTNLHAYAMPAATAAEAAREQGKFWPVHDALLRVSLDTQAINSVVRAQRLDPTHFERSRVTTAKMAVDSDIKDAKRMGLISTPSFVLCCPDGRVVHLPSLNHLTEYVR